MERGQKIITNRKKHIALAGYRIYIAKTYSCTYFLCLYEIGNTCITPLMKYQ